MCVCVLGGDGGLKKVIIRRRLFSLFFSYHGLVKFAFGSERFKSLSRFIAESNFKDQSTFSMLNESDEEDQMIYK